MNLNKVFLIGNISSDIELKTTVGGKFVATFSLATNRKTKDKNGETKEYPTYHKIVVWEKAAETISQYLAKGSLLFIEGRIENRTYEKKDGSKGYVSEVIIENFQFGPKVLNSYPSETSRTKHDEIKPEPAPEDIPIIEDEIPEEEPKAKNKKGKELEGEDDEIDVKDIPF